MTDTQQPAHTVPDAAAGDSFVKLVRRYESGDLEDGGYIWARAERGHLELHRRAAGSLARRAGRQRSRRSVTVAAWCLAGPAIALLWLVYVVTEPLMWVVLALILFADD